MIFTADEFINTSDDTRRKYIYSLFLDKNNKLEVHKLFILKYKEKLDDELLSIALVASLVKGNYEFFNKVFNFADKNNILFKTYQIQGLVNIALIKNELDIIDYLDKKFNIINAELSVGKTFSLTDGRIFFEGCYPCHLTDKVIFDPLESFSNNCFLYQVEEGNEDAIHILINKGQILNEKLVEAALIKAIISQNKKALNLLAKIEKVQEIIISSKSIQLFLNEETEFVDEKKLWQNIVLSNKLENNLINKEDSQIRVKI